MKWYLIGIALLSLLASAGAAKYLYDQNSKLKTELAIKEAQNAEILKTANRHANRPRSRNDVDNILCQRARAAAERENPTDKRLPVRPCP